MVILALPHVRSAQRSYLVVVQQVTQRAVALNLLGIPTRRVVRGIADLVEMVAGNLETRLQRTRRVSNYAYKDVSDSE